MNEDILTASLKRKGWVQAQDGSWNPPAKHSNLGRLVRPKREPDPIPALESSPPARRSRKTSVERCNIELISFRRRLLDDDNLQGGLKALRDAISKSLGVDDGDPMLSWHYRQVRTEGRPGTLVKISVKSPG